MLPEHGVPQPDATQSATFVPGQNPKECLSPAPPVSRSSAAYVQPPGILACHVQRTEHFLLSKVERLLIPLHGIIQMRTSRGVRCAACR